MRPASARWSLQASSQGPAIQRSPLNQIRKKKEERKWARCKGVKGTRYISKRNNGVHPTPRTRPCYREARGGGGDRRERACRLDYDIHTKSSFVNVFCGFFPLVEREEAPKAPFGGGPKDFSKFDCP